MTADRTDASEGAEPLTDRIWTWRDSLVQARDELRLKAHLAGRELVDRREALERERTVLEARVKKAGETAVGGATRVGGELQSAWKEALETFKELRAELSKREDQ